MKTVGVTVTVPEGEDPQMIYLIEEVFAGGEWIEGERTAIESGAAPYSIPLKAGSRLMIENHPEYEVVMDRSQNAATMALKEYPDTPIWDTPPDP